MESEKQVALELAAFLDSNHARALSVPGKDSVRRIGEAFLQCCYGGIGKKPELLDGEDVRSIFRQLLPGHMRPKDPLAEHAAEVVGAYVDHLEETRVVTQGFEIRTALLEAAPAFVRSVARGENTQRAADTRPKTVVHRADKLGRNEPCFCGSGKKFKKCHGKSS